MKQIMRVVDNSTYFRLQVAKSLFEDGILTGSASLMLLGFIDRENINDLDIIFPAYRELPGRIVIRGPVHDYGPTFHGKLNIAYKEDWFKERYEWLCALEGVLNIPNKFKTIIDGYWPAVDTFINPAEPYRLYQLNLSTQTDMGMLNSSIVLKLADTRNTINAKLQYLLRFDKEHHYEDCMITLGRLYGGKPLNPNSTFKEI